MIGKSQGIDAEIPVACVFLRAVSPLVATSHPLVAHALSVPRRDSSRRLEPAGRRSRNTALGQDRHDCRSPVGRATVPSPGGPCLTNHKQPTKPNSAEAL